MRAVVDLVRDSDGKSAFGWDEIYLTKGLAGKPANSLIQPLGVAPRAFTIAQSLCSALAIVAATASTVVQLRKRTAAGSSTTLGTFTWGAGASVATAVITQPNVGAGDLLFLHYPATADTTLADIGFLVAEGVPEEVVEPGVPSAFGPDDWDLEGAPEAPGVPEAFGPDDWSLGEGDTDLDETIPAPWFELLTAQDQYPPNFEFEIPYNVPVEVCNLRLVGGNESFSALTVNLLRAPIGTGDFDFTELDTIEDGENFFRARIENPVTGKHGPWSRVLKHGDTTAPVLSGDDDVSEMEGVENPTGTVTCSETATFTVTGPDAGLVSITPGPAGVATWTINETTDYYFGKRSYAFSIVATDLAGLESDPFPIVYNVTENPATAPDPRWIGTTGTNKSTYLTVSGDPLLTAANDGSAGVPGYVRCLRAAVPDKFQVEYTIAALGADGFITIGVDNGTADFASYVFGGTPNSVQMQTTNGGQTIYVNGTNVHEASVDIAVGDVIGFRCDQATGEIEFYRVRSSSVTTIHSRSFTPYADNFAINGLKAWGVPAEATVNFGASSYARALSDDFEAY